MSEDSAATMGRNRKAYTGIKIAYIPYHSIHTKKYCSGSTARKDSSSALWSPRRVGAMVMNSRSAMKEAKANRIITPARPIQTAPPITPIISHQDLMRAFRLSIVAFGLSKPARHLSRKPTSEANTRMPPAPANSHTV